MDNASKALIMAGAILISLALVGLGVYIFSMSKDIQGNTTQTMDALTAQTTNTQLSNYAGKKVRGSNVLSFLAYVDTLNSQNAFPIDISNGTVSGYTFTATSGDITSANKGNVLPNSYYEIALADLQPTGAVDGYYDTYQIKAY
jgi:hypothetical protein